MERHGEFWTKLNDQSFIDNIDFPSLGASNRKFEDDLGEMDCEMLNGMDLLADESR
jgi:hypothetical protein